MATADSLPQRTDALGWGPGLLISRSPPGIGSRRSQGSPRFLGKPPCVHALGGYPGGSSTPGLFGAEDGAFRSSHDVGSPFRSLSRLVTTACTLAVYASQLRVTPQPRKTRFRWGASPCRVGFGPTGSATKSFRIYSPSSFPPSQAWPGARNVSTPSAEGCSCFQSPETMFGASKQCLRPSNIVPRLQTMFGTKKQCLGLANNV